MKFSLVSSLLLLLIVISAYVSGSVIHEDLSVASELSYENGEDATSNELAESASLDDDAQQEHSSRVRRSCDCRRKSGECVSYGTYQCSSRRDAVVVQCLGYKWVRIGACPNSCRILSNNQPYCF